MTPQKSTSELTFEELVQSSRERHGDAKVNWLLSLTLEQLFEYASLYCEIKVSRLGNQKRPCLSQQYWIALMLPGTWYYRISHTLLEGVQGVLLATCTYPAFAERVFQFSPDAVNQEG